MDRRLSYILVAVAIVAVGLAMYGYALYVRNGATRPMTKPSLLVFGSNYDSENVTMTELPVGSNVSFEGVTFTRTAYLGLPNEPTGFNVSFSFSSGGFHGWAASPSQDGSWGYAQDPSTGQLAGYIVYPSRGVIELIVQG